MGAIWAAVVSSLPGRAEELQRLDEVVRTPLPLSTRVGFVGVAGGVGCSTVAGLAAGVLAARRPYRILAVNASQSPRSLLWHAGRISPARSGPQQDEQRRSARHSAQAVAGLGRTPAGLHCLDLYEPDLYDEPDDKTGVMSDHRWWQAVAPAGRFFDFVLTDWGIRDAASLPGVTVASAVLCVVAPAERSALQHAVDLGARAAESGAAVVLAAVQSRPGRAGMAELVRLLPFPAVLFGPDPAHGAARPQPGSRLRAGTTLAALRLSAALIEARRAASQGRQVRSADQVGPGAVR